MNRCAEGATARPVTQWLRRWRDSPADAEAASFLLSAVYAELHRVAAQRIARESNAEATPTELVHETWLRLVPGQVPCEDRHAFMRFASVAMRNALVDQARERAAEKRGGQWQRITITLQLSDGATAWPIERLLDLDRALCGLAEEHARVAKTIELRAFAGLELTEVAAVLGVSLATVKRDLAFGRAWIADALKDDA